MTIATYTHAENAEFLADLAKRLAHDGTWPQEQIDRLNTLAANEAERDPAYVAYVNNKVRAALANPGRMFTEAEIDSQIASW